MKKTIAQIAQIVQYIIFLGIGIFLVWWSLQQIPADKWDDFKQSLSTANFWLLIPVFAILSASHLLRAIRWKTLMQPMGYKPTTTNTFFAVMIGYLANLAVPRLGEVLKCTVLAKYEKVPADKLVGTIVVERAVDVVCLLLVFVATFALQYDVIGAYGKELLQKLFNKQNGGSNIGLNITVLVLGVVAIVMFVLIKKYPTAPVISTIHKIIKGITEGLLSIKNLQQKGLFIACTISIWLLYILGTWVGLYATIGTENLGLPVAISALAFASIGMIITPGGIGAYAFFLAEVLYRNGVPFEIGFANGTLQWFAQFLIVVLVGFICVGLLPWFNKNYTPKHETNTSHRA
jgi:glycosyltransferase 2 family protein